MPLRLDNAKALPTCPQQTQQKHNKLKPRFQLTVRLAQCQRTSAARTPRPRARSNRRGGRHRLGIPGRLHIGTPGRLRRNPQPMIEKAGTGRLRARLGPGGRMPRSSPEAVVSPSPTSFFLVPCSLPLAPCPLPIWRRGRSSSSRARCENWAAGNFDIADLAVRWVVPLVVTSFVALRRQRVTRSNRVGYATKSMPYISASVLK